VGSGRPLRGKSGLPSRYNCSGPPTTALSNKTNISEAMVILEVEVTL
jgi:hypothetical protein